MDDFILTLRLAPLPRVINGYEFCGYWCRKKYQGFGYMTEAVQAVIDYAFDTLAASELKIIHAEGNHKTRAVMDRVGFVEQAVIPNAHCLPDGSVVGEFILKMTKSDYQKI